MLVTMTAVMGSMISVMATERREGTVPAPGIWSSGLLFHSGYPALQPVGMEIKSRDTLGHVQR